MEISHAGKSCFQFSSYFGFFKSKQNNLACTCGRTDFSVAQLIIESYSGLIGLWTAERVCTYTIPIEHSGGLPVNISAKDSDISCFIKQKVMKHQKNCKYPTTLTFCYWSPSAFSHDPHHLSCSGCSSNVCNGAFLALNTHHNFLDHL